MILYILKRAHISILLFKKLYFQSIFPILCFCVNKSKKSTPNLHYFLMNSNNSQFFDSPSKNLRYHLHQIHYSRTSYQLKNHNEALLLLNGVNYLIYYWILVFNNYYYYYNIFIKLVKKFFFLYQFFGNLTYFIKLRKYRKKTILIMYFNS